MEKVHLLLFQTFISIFAFGQITKTAVAASKNGNEVDSSPYDSTKNFLGKEVYKYIGQELYLKGMPESKRNYGYENFYNKASYRIFHKLINFNGNTKYEALAEKYFTVLDVVKVLDLIKDGNEEENRLSYGNKYFLRLIEKEKKDTIYYEYSTDSEFDFPFIVTGFFIKQKREAIGKKFVIRGRNWNERGAVMTDMKTGNPVSDFEGGAVWTCADLTIEEKYYDLALILENSKHEQIPLSFYQVNEEYWLFEISKAIFYKTKFGEENWQRIVQGKVKIGMTDAMCKLSWGEPKKVSETITEGKKSQQWIYADKYLYITNGVLTAIQSTQ